MNPFPSSKTVWSLAVTMFGLSLLTAAARATNYYIDSIAGVDTNNGTSTGTPWKTLTKVNSITFLPGDNVLFKRGGSWTGNLHLLGNGSSTAPLVVDAYDSGPAPLIAGGGGPQAIEIWNKQYVTIQNLEITNDAATAGNRNGILIAFTTTAGVYSGIKILNNDIHNVRAHTDTSLNAQSNAAIFIRIQDNSVGARIDNLLIQGNYLYDLRTGGIFQKAPSYYNGHPEFWATNEVIRDNIIDKTGSDGIVIMGAMAPLIENNAAFECGINSDGFASLGGMWSSYFCQDPLFQFNEVGRTYNADPANFSSDAQAFDCDLGATGNNIFQYNYTHDNAGGVLIMMWEQVAKTVIYRYNLSVNDDRQTNAGTQLPINPILGINSAHVYNNVFYSTRALGYKLKDNPASLFYNNIFHVTSAIYPSQTNFSNNCYFGHVPDVNDPYRVLADPKFVGPLTAVGGDFFGATTTDIFKLQSSSPCINAGKNITAPISNGGIDFWGNPLYAGGYADIGIHEVVGGSNPPPAAVTFTDDPASTSVIYTGSGWTHTADSLYYNNTKSVSPTVGNSVQYTFTGTNVSIFGRKGPAYGKINISIDGGAPVLIDCYWALDLYRKELFRASGLSNSGSHTVAVTIATKNVSSTANSIAIDYFQQMPVDPGALPLVAQYDIPANGIFVGTWSYTPTDLSKFYGGTRASSSTVGNSMSFTFTGNGVRLYGSKASTLGKLSITIDGGAATLVNCFQPSTADKYDYLAKLYEINGLSSTGTHTLVATVATKDAASSGNSVSLDLFEVLTGGASAPVDVIMDDTTSPGVTLTGAWTASTFTPGYYGAGYINDGNIAKGSKSVRFRPTLPTAGTYEVFAWWTAGTNRASNVPIDIISTSGTTTVTVNQQLNGSQWVSLGTYAFDAGTGGSVLIRNTATNGYVMADAVRFLKP